MRLSKYIVTPIAVSVILSLLLTVKSANDQLYSGPSVNKEIVQQFGGYALYALSRLAFYSSIIMSLMALLGSICYLSLIKIFKFRYNLIINILFCVFSIFSITSTVFLEKLFYSPSTIVSSFNYDILRLIPIWELLSPVRLYVLYAVVALLFSGPIILYSLLNIKYKKYKIGLVLLGFLSLYPLVFVLAQWQSEPDIKILANKSNKYPNIIMIGSDTLRADRLGVNGNDQGLTPTIDTIATQGVNFGNCIVPIARTAPSITSFLTSTWPKTHGIRFNFIGDDEKEISVPTLPKLLKEHGYITAAVGDWAAGDLSKYDFGFDVKKLPEDQWNLKYLLRQGPKDLRLFLSLFTNNNFGKFFIPELYYLAGVPLTSEIGHDSRLLIGNLAKQDKPFFLNIFMAATHGPFGSNWPYYRMYADPNYRGRSFFAMSGVSSPEEIVKAQEAGKQHFDVKQIFSLYNGAVRSFDDEVAKIFDYINKIGIADDTIFIIYSDHGVDLFEGATWGQGNILSDYGYRIPLIIRFPKIIKRTNVNSTIRSIDLAPTILQLAGIPSPTNWEGDSLLDLVLDPSSRVDRYAYAETGIWIAKVPGLPEDRISYPSVLELLEVKNHDTGTLSIKNKYKEVLIRAKAKMVRHGKWELVYFPLKSGEIYSLYDVYSDPALKTDLSGQNPEIVKDLKVHLDDWINNNN